QPRGQLWLLLSLEIGAIVDAFNRLLIGALGGRDPVGGKELRHLVALCGVAERAGSAYDLSAREWATGLFDFSPVLADEIPGQLLTVWIAQHSSHQLQSILRANVGRD